VEVRTLHSATWRWIDVVASAHEADEFLDTIEGLDRLDDLAVHDALHESDLPKVDDFGDHMLIVLHGLDQSDLDVCEIDCFVSADELMTVHSEPSAALDAIWDELDARPQLLPSAPMELTASIADVVARRQMRVVDLFDERADELMIRALEADVKVMADVAAIRADLSEIRKSIHPQRETIDVLRRSDSSLITDGARRRFADVFDVAMRTTAGLDSARTALSETLEAYRGAEARRATDVSRVLTIYAAIMLPLSLIVGFFGMNHENLPTLDQEWGWLVVTGFMVTITAVSLGIFVSVGWIKKPTSREAATTLGQGLAEAARAPVQVVGSLLALTTRPLRAVRRLPSRPHARRTFEDPAE